MNYKKIKELPLLLIISGLLVGIFAGLLAKFGNPGNMGICIACFIRDCTGAVGLHQVAPVQYLRPEILGIILGATIAAFFGKELTAKSGSSPALRFVLGAFVMVGALVFLGCPTRLVLRLGGGDINAIFGLIGFVAGILVGSYFLKQGTTLGRCYKEKTTLSIYIMPTIAVAGLLLLYFAPSFIKFSIKGPGKMHAPILLSLTAGIIIGILGQRSRLCFAGGIRDLFLFKSTHLLSGFVAVFIGVLILNLSIGKFHLSMSNQPAAHTIILWNILGMLLVGFASSLLGGCPFRQLVLASQGNSDSAITVAGMMAGAAIAHNFKLAATPKGVSTNGMIAVVMGIIICLIIAILSKNKIKN